MEKPILDFLEYLVLQCVKRCKVDPDKTTVTDFLETIRETGRPVGA
jgi:hypothetical protein